MTITVAARSESGHSDAVTIGEISGGCGLVRGADPLWVVIKTGRLGGFEGWMRRPFLKSGADMQRLELAVFDTPRQGLAAHAVGQGA
jgi:hypothetical protein